MKNIVEVIQFESRERAGKTAFIEGSRVISYGDLLSRTAHVSEKLKGFGMGRGDRAALLCDDGIEYVIVSLAVLKLSAVIVPVPFASSREEIEAVLKEMRVNFLIYEKGAYTFYKARPLKIESGPPGREFFIAGRMPAGDAPSGLHGLDPAFIRFSSGTTGTRKGVIISHEAIIQRTDAADKGLRVTEDDRILWVLSMSFHFVVTILLFLRRGATVILAGNSFPGSLLGALKEHRPSFVYASPLHYHLLATLTSVPREALAGARLAVSTAVELPAEIAGAFRAKFGFELSQAYGIIEVGLPFVNLSRSVRKRGSVGRILPDYRIKIVNPDSRGAGEICLKGTGLFSAYFSPWKQAREVLKGGWFDTGDIGRMDKDGFLFILGRAKNVINFSGMKIFPFEVESVLVRHPAVKEALVYGLAHPEYGNLPAADIVLKKGRADKFDAEELRAFCYRHLAKYKVPKEFRCVEKLERTLSGKLIRGKIKG